MMKNACINYILEKVKTVLFLLLLSIVVDGNAQAKKPAVYLEDGQLAYVKDSLGNRVPDFSYAGYKLSNTLIPDVSVAVWVDHKPGDQTSRIQKAIDYVSALPLNESGFRGAILLEPGVYEIAGGLQIKASGVVLRGSGPKEEETVLLGTGLDRTTLIGIYGTDDRKFSEPINITSDYVPVGSFSFQVENTANLKVGDLVQITRPSTEDWINKLDMSDFGGETRYIGWKPGERDIRWTRTITKLQGNVVTIDAPITTALDATYGGGYIQKMSWKGRINNIGVENLKLQSTFDETNLKDEQHRWMAITIENATDVWVRQVNFEHFAGSAVAVWKTGSRVTVEDCKSLNPVSEIGGQRRYTFFTEGEQCLFQRLYSEYGYHDFSVGFTAAGPNAFVECKSHFSHNFSGAIDSWASGVLFDVVNIDGHALSYGNRGMEDQGAGWTAANSMFWQSTAPLIECPAPPTAQNWAFAVWSQFSGNGVWHEVNGFIKPRSLFYGQLSDRIGNKALSRAHLLPLTNEASSSPTITEAAEYVVEAQKPQPQLKDWIDLAGSRTPILIDKGKSKSVDRVKVKREKKVVSDKKSINLENGKILVEGKLKVGDRATVQWWRGNVRPYDAQKARPHVTRYVPGRVGIGWTDDLEESTDILLDDNRVILDHNYGLWYDRRRDDHQRIRRMNGEVWAPFYELPFARSGIGIAWDGMSKYDLTSYNYWYWNRLREFADLADEKGLILYHQNYFQHNILEAGGHYADFPWRTANNINDTPFPEPVNYAGDKRVFMAEQFYDVSDPEYRALHVAYIKKCLDNFSDNSNVIQFVSAEYTGPLSFVQFWIDVIKEWQDETGNDPLIALSTTKDVQDAILADPIRSIVIDVIDIRYWYYGENKEGSIELYAPKGGQNLAPRQHARLVKTPKETFESTYKAVAEYTGKFPGKAVIHNTHRSAAFGWGIFMAGGSLMNIPKIASDQFLSNVSAMNTTFVKDGIYVLMNEETGERVCYMDQEKPLEIDLTEYSGAFEMCWIDSESGEIVGKDELGSARHLLDSIDTSVLWIRKK